MPAYFRPHRFGLRQQILKQAKRLRRHLGAEAPVFIDENAVKALKNGNRSTWKRWRRLARALDVTAR